MLLDDWLEMLDTFTFCMRFVKIIDVNCFGYLILTNGIQSYMLHHTSPYLYPLGFCHRHAIDIFLKSKFLLKQ